MIINLTSSRASLRPQDEPTYTNMLFILSNWCFPWSSTEGVEGLMVKLGQMRAQARAQRHTLMHIHTLMHVTTHATQTQNQDEGIFVARLPNECGHALDGAPPDPRRLSVGQGKEHNLTICPQTTQPTQTEKPIATASTLNQSDTPCWH